MFWCWSARERGLPVIWINGYWTLQSGLAVEFKDGAVGELHVDSAALIDQNFIMAATRVGKSWRSPPGPKM
jgi:hypothetical protein